MPDDRRRQFQFSDPEIRIDKTEALGDRWVASGQLIIEIMRGDGVAVGSMSLPFNDAESKEMARNQAMNQLAILTEQLQELSRVQEPSAQQQAA